MCLEQVGRVVTTGDGRAVVARGKARAVVSLVILTLEGVPVVSGDWLVMHSGIAVRKISAEEAAGMAAVRDGAGGRRP
ncbi:HypC/HybG/HupF family hydrogenase formation chaperone [Actinomadura bangladeshensis]|uniref:HypC/HybG/HupF family hydrogenase formation chaperone n=1 Tax=Actinomadura bangladeshensis TaxID=453573 RepID=A0A4R4P7J9_9ACTN|nr:HypC/HybG/HupF family hydrogenase formation chaperone [Actinomadura bangladeshensis]TDC16142.1 hypothetical protein E1284_13415 [Actinomadura bangladeshensis]